MIMELRDSSRPLERVGIVNLRTMRLQECGKDLGKKTYDSWKAATSSTTSGKMKLRRDQSSAKLFYEDPETAYNKNLTTLTCDGVPVKSILPALGYFLISRMRIESMFFKRWPSSTMT